jgi:predicted nucleic acid-binding protein
MPAYVIDTDIATYVLEGRKEVVAVDTEVARVAGELRRLNNAGRPVEQCPTCHRRLGGRLRLPDALVAATAITESAVLVTHNVKDYGHLVGRGLLTVENPLDGRARASSYE